MAHRHRAQNILSSANSIEVNAELPGHSAQVSQKNDLPLLLDVVDQGAARYRLAAMSIGVVGLGYVGLPLAVAFADAGEEVVAVDVDPRKVAAIRDGDSYVEDVPSERLREVLSEIHATSHYQPLARTDAIVICVPTPLTANREPDLGALTSAGQAVGQVIQHGQLVVLESTTYPGTTRECLVPILEQESELIVGEDVSVAFSPERVDPGRTDYTLRNTPKVIGGMTPACGDRAAELYGLICDQLVRVSTPEAAEMTKLLENIFRSVNIALVNELTILADRMGIDIWEVVDAASTKPYGFMRFEPGPGMGGHCLPVDPFYLSWRAREFDMSTEFIELAGKINQQMPYHCVERIEHALNDVAKPVKGSRIAIIGVSYKGGIGDNRESPALRIMQVLNKRGAELSYHDPYVASLPDLGLASSPLSDCIPAADAVVLVTAHPSVDHGAIARDARLFIDFRGVTRGQRAENLVRI
jgi:UDP-N-acetyl-D-glucosamine dehydrogenase